MRSLAVLLVLCAAAAAETRVDQSIEWCVVDSDLIVRGRIVTVREEAREKESRWHRVTVVVEEALKGKAEAKVQFITQDLESVEDWRKRKAELLLFLVKSSRYGADERQLGHVDRAPWAPQDLSFDAHELASVHGLTDRDGNDYAKRDAKLAAVRRAIEAMPQGRLPSAIVNHPPVPNDNAIFGPQYLIVPVDSHLEKQGRSLLTHEKMEWRARGVRMLKHFHTRENADLLRGLMKDPGTIGLMEPIDLTIYPVRIEAWRVLKEWDEPFRTRPVLFK